MKKIIIILSVFLALFFIGWLRYYRAWNTPRYISYIYDSDKKTLNYIVYGGKHQTIKYRESGLFYLVKTNYDTINFVYAGEEISDIQDLIMSFSDVRNDTNYNELQARENNIQFFYDSVSNQSDEFFLHSFYVGELDSSEVLRFQQIKDSLIISLKEYR